MCFLAFVQQFLGVFCWFVTFCLEICQAVLGFDVVPVFGYPLGFLGL